MNIHKSFAMGNKGEQFAQNIFVNGGIECKKNEDYEKRYDYDLECKIGRKKFTCEVKFDAMAQKTGNLAIEFRNCKKDEPSGIDITKANLWIHMVMDDTNMTMWVTSVTKLKDYIKNNKPFRTIAVGGDQNASLYLYKDEVLFDAIFVRADMLDEKELKKAVRRLLK